ncbi:MAG TPA: PilZ domain-containing protein [bacterium]|nr:PilZ domain-containing protein [bacterium]
MASGELERKYDRMVEDSRLRGQAEQGRTERERRREARILPDAALLDVEGDPWVYLINVSRQGLAFFADTPHKPGVVLPISLESGLTAQAKVVDCRPEAGDPGALAGQFRICCEFNDAEEGLRFFVALNELETARLEATR